MSYYDTERACNSMNAYLATIDDQEEFNFIGSTLLENYSSNDDLIWVNKRNYIFNFK